MVGHVYARKRIPQGVPVFGSFDATKFSNIKTRLVSLVEICHVNSGT